MIATKFRVIGTALGFCIFSGCAIQQNPLKKPMQQSTLEQIKSPQSVNLQIPERNGIAVSYFAQDSSAAGAQYGLIGALTTAVIDGIANANPLEIAKENSNRLSQSFHGPDLLSQAYTAIANNKGQYPSQLNLRFSAPTPYSANAVKATKEGLNITVFYSFKSNMSGFSVSANVSLNAKDVTYKSPYDKTNAKPDKSGIAYQNLFTYYSNQLAVPVKSQQEINTQVEEIKAKYTKKGTLPKRDTPEASKMAREIKAAQAPEYNAKEVATKLADQWLANDGEKLKVEIQAAHQFLAKQIAQDLNRLDVPSFTGSDTIIETNTDGRVVKMVGASYSAGQITSTPKDFLEAGWGNVNILPDPEKNEATKKVSKQ